MTIWDYTLDKMIWIGRDSLDNDFA